jgi:hypothetical protein
MATTVKNLGVGSITTATVVPLVPQSGKSWLITSLSLTNRNVSPVLIDVKFTSIGGTAYALVPPGMTIPAQSTLVIDSEITLIASPSVLAEKVTLASSSTLSLPIDWVASGVERDIV